MPESNTNSSPPSTKFISFLLPIIAAATLLLIFRVDPFDPAPFPTHEFTHKNEPLFALKVNSQILRDSDKVGSGRVLGPEDLVYEPGTRVIYTGCHDGWVKRVKIGETGSDPVVEDWVNTGGRPLGLAIASHGADIIVADGNKGLLKITQNKEMKVLTNEAEGITFKITDGVSLANDGIIYFTDASYKYTLEDYFHDILESRPYGRLLSFDPKTEETKVLLRDLYFPNGVSVSPDQYSLIFCETPMKRCRRYWLRGERAGFVDGFIDNLPGFPDNIHYDGKSGYLIAISSWLSPYLEQLRISRLVRKSMFILEKYISLQFLQKNGGILSVDLQGNPTAHFYDPSMSLITSGITVDDHMYIGSLQYPHIIRFNLSINM